MQYASPKWKNANGLFANFCGENDIRNINLLRVCIPIISTFVQKSLNMKGVCMCKVMEDMGNEALKEGMREVVFRMLLVGKYAIEEIADISGLSFEEVEQMKTDRNV